MVNIIKRLIEQDIQNIRDDRDTQYDFLLKCPLATSERQTLDAQVRFQIMGDIVLVQEKQYVPIRVFQEGKPSCFHVPVLDLYASAARWAE